MSQLKKAKPVKLVIGMFGRSTQDLNQAQELLMKRFGKTDYRSEDFNFAETSYYEKEMGASLKRRFLSFVKPVKRKALAQIKKYCVLVERKLAETTLEGECRRVNIDPGLLSLENFVLATGKGYAHRVYLSKGVWADLTLIYEGEAYRTLPWTYPDYKEPQIQDILLAIRSLYHEQLEQARAKSAKKS